MSATAPPPADPRERATRPGDDASAAGDPIAAHAAIPETVLEPRGLLAAFDFAELWRYRDLLLLLAWRDVSVRYKQTALGVVWAALRPALLMAVFVLFVGPRLGAGDGALPYAVFAYAGLLVWTLFATILGGAADSVVGAERMITKIYFPRLLIPAAAAAPAVVDFAVGGVFLAGLMAWHGVAPGATVLLAPLPLAVAVVLAVGLGAFLAALNVVYRDVRFAIPFFIQAGLFATPAIYLPEPPVVEADETEEAATLRDWATALNPMNAVIGFFRAAVTGGPLPWTAFGRACLLTVVIVPVSVAVFRGLERSFADLI